MQAKLVLLVVAVAFLGVGLGIEIPSAKTTESLRLIEFGTGQRKWMSQSELQSLVQVGKKNNFIDVTESPVAQMAPPSLQAIPSGPKHQVSIKLKYYNV